MRRRGRRWRSFGAGLIVPLVVCCANELEPGDREIIDRWLHCAECRSGERAAVRNLGPRVVPVLKRALEEGPPQDYLDNMRLKFEGLYTSVLRTTTSPLDSSALPRAAYVERGVANYVATYQKRAATSLSDIGGPEAAAALRGALSGGTAAYRPDVVDAIRARQLPPDTAQFLGRISPSAVPFGDTVTVQPPATEPFDGNEQAAIEGSPVSPNETKVSDSTAAELKFIATGFPGERRVTIHNVGTPSRHADIAILTLKDPNDRAMAGCANPACQANQAPRYTTVSPARSNFLTLWRSASSVDTVDMVKFEPSDSLRVTATLSWWPTTANLDLGWTNCTMSESRGNTDGATSSRPEESTVHIPGNRCWLLLIVLRDSGTVPPVVAHLRLSP